MVNCGSEEAISQVERLWAKFPIEPRSPSAPPDPAAAPDPLERARTFLSRGDAVRARQAAQQAVGLSLLDGDSNSILQAMAADASALLMHGKYNTAEHVISTMEASLRIDDAAGRAVALEMRGWWGNRVGRHGSGHFELARFKFAQAERICRSNGDWEGAVRCLEGRAGSEGGIGDYPRALETIEEAVTVARHYGISSRMHRLALETVMIAKDGGYERFGLDAFPTVIASCEAAGDAASLGRALLGHASVLAHRASTHPDRAKAAEAQLRRLIALAGGLGLSALVLEARIALIDLLSRTGAIQEEQAETQRLEATADQLPSSFALQLYYREKEQQALYREKLLRQVARLRSALDTSEDAILIFDPRSAPEGAFVDFFCESGNSAAMAMLQPRGLGVLILSELAKQPILKGIEAMVQACCRLGTAQQDEILIQVLNEERFFSRRVLPISPGAAVCLRDITDQTHRAREVEENVLRTLRESLRLELEHQELVEVNRQLGRLAATDGLTGLLNHRAFQERLDEELQRARRLETDLSLVLLDLDRFKRLNDDQGHQTGDRVLRGIADALLAVARAYDSVARYGGEEFAVILPGADREEATAAAERMRAAIEKLFSDPYNITASFGVASFSDETPSQEIFIDQSDKALYASKRAGRNRVTHAANLNGIE